MKMYRLDNEFRDTVGSFNLFPEVDASRIESQDVLRGAANFFEKFYSGDISFNGMFLSYGDTVGAPFVPHALCDMHSWIGAKPSALVYPVSAKFKQVVSIFNTQNVCFYNGNIFWNGEIKEYHVMHLLANQYIDFNKSTFVKCNFRGVKKSDEIKIGASMDQLNEIYGNDSFTFERAVMKPEFKEIDMHYFDIWGILITERLKNAIKAANLTG